MGRLSNRDFFEDRFAHLSALPEHILLDLARNDACPIEYRLTAVEIMVKKGYQKVKHPELARFLEHLQAEKEEFGEREFPEISLETPVSTAVESQKTAEIGPPSASVTSKTLFGSPENGQNGSV